jgi:hypothetical protein
VLAVGLGACSSDEEPKPANTPAALAAKQLVDDLAAGNFGAVTARFDPNMAKNMNDVQLAQTWHAYQARYGTYESRGEPKEIDRGTITIEQVPVQLSKEKGEVRISYHPDLTVAGLYMLEAGEPLPP